jgi:Flp pilus assembly protein TadG
MRAFLRSLDRDERGIAAVEFAITVPAFLILLMGGFDLGHTQYMQVVLQGTVQKASRDLTLASGEEAAQQTVIDTRVRAAIRDLNSSLTDSDINISRSAYKTFSQAQAKLPEDANGDGVCSAGEVWIDRNFNGVYDADGGSNGQGGAKDVVVYAVTVSYPRLFPTAGLIGLPTTVKLNATTVLANQPYGDQTTPTGSLAPRNCT